MKNKILARMRTEILGDSEDTSKDDIFGYRIEDAKTIALNTLYPFDMEAELDEDNERLVNWIARCAIELYNADSRKGVSTYSENGLSVTYLSTLITPDLLKELIPRAGVVK